MNEELKAFTINLLFLNPQQIKKLPEITTPIIFEGNTQDFNRQGLFSTDSFGKVATPERNTNFAQIKLNTEILHPLIFKHLVSLSTQYLPIMQSKRYVTFNKKLGMFEDASPQNGDTGYGFFLSHFNDLKFVENSSTSRKYKIDLINKYRKEGKTTLNSFLVLPAGLRDFSLDEKGNPQEDEVNDLYRRLLGSTNLLRRVSTSVANSPAMSPVRMNVQNNIQLIYMHFMKLLDGKKKFINGKFTARATSYGTRNVLTGLPSKVTDLENTENIIGMQNVVVGLFQYAKAISPVAKANMKSKILNHIFSPHSETALLTDLKNFTTTPVEIPPDVKDSWLSDEGLEGILNKIGDEDNLDSPVMLGDKYIGCIYDDGNNVKVMVDVNNLPEDRDRKHVRAMTYAELIYLSLVGGNEAYPALVTRYPITGQGSIYPAITHLKTTVVGREVNFLDSNWEVGMKLFEYPSAKDRYFVSMAISHSALAASGADFDGFFDLNP